jgi:hypothetical protein
VRRAACHIIFSSNIHMGADMKTNVPTSERTPRIAIALAAAAAAAFAPGLWLKSVLLGSSAAMLATVATGYCPVTAAVADTGAEPPHWRTLRVHRVEA